MGTRNITQVILGGKTLVSQYGQWDGYPEGQGATILEFLKGMNREQFERRLRATEILDEDIINTRWADAFQIATMAVLNEENKNATDDDRLNDLEILAKYDVLKKRYDETGMVGMDVSNEFTKNHPTLQRNMGSGILQHIYESTDPVDVKLDLDFVKESLFCEWAYVVDLDNNVLEVYEGFNQSPVPADNRFQFSAEERPHETSCGETKYYPVRLIQSFPLDDLPDEKTFINVCTPNEDEDNRTSNDVFNSVVINLRTMASGNAPEDDMLKHMMNYIEANKNDFMEAVGI